MNYRFKLCELGSCQTLVYTIRVFLVIIIIIPGTLDGWDKSPVIVLYVTVVYCTYKKNGTIIYTRSGPTQVGTFLSALLYTVSLKHFLSTLEENHTLLANSY